jgi:hypothetical protein
MKNIEHPPIIQTDRLVLRQWNSARLGTVRLPESKTPELWNTFQA